MERLCAVVHCGRRVKMLRFLNSSSSLNAITEQRDKEISFTWALSCCLVFHAFTSRSRISLSYNAFVSSKISTPTPNSTQHRNHDLTSTQNHAPLH